jgi:hypothetical protein
MTDENTTETVEETVAAEAAAPGLSIGDMATLKSIVEVASTRGAFRAEEMEVVGRTYNKLAAFVQAAIPQQEETAEADGEEAEAEEA